MSETVTPIDVLRRMSAPSEGKPEFETFERKTFEVQAIRVTEENMGALAIWAKGEIKSAGESAGDFIDIDVHRPMTDRQRMAFVGDWILVIDKKVKVYTDRAFITNFIKKN